MNIDIKILANTLLEIEDEFHLLEWEIDGVYLWQSARAKIYEMIAYSLYTNNDENNKNSRHKTPTNIFFIFKRIFTNGLLLNPYFDLKRTDNLIFESGRKEFVDGEYIDIYTKYLIDCLNDSNESYTIYSSGSPLRKIRKSYRFNKSLDVVHFIGKIISRIFKKDFNLEDKMKINKIEKIIKIKLGVEINIHGVFKSEIKRFKSQYLSYKSLFYIKRAKNIFLIGSGHKAPLIKAAKDSGVLVSELQHGLILKEGIIANYPYSKNDSVQYFPDRFFLWSNLNMCSAKLPLSKENILFFPNFHLDYMVKTFSNNERKPKQITIISQPFIGKKIFEYIMSNIQKMKDWHFIYKLHPSENLIDYELYDYPINELSNIEFVTDEISIYKLISDTNIVIGVFSTALFEAKHFNCKIILLDIPGVELAGLLLNQKNVIKIKLSEDLYEKVLFFSI